MKKNRRSSSDGSGWTPHPVRRGQLISPFGVGAMVDYPNESLMVAGLDAWPENAPEVKDERLAARLGVSSFKAPPAPPNRDQPSGGFVPAVRFPLWHMCPACETLRKIAWNEWDLPRCQSCQKRLRMVPLRFVTACAAGHIDDFPWVAWAHRKAGQDLREVRGCDSPKLKLKNWGRAGLDGLRVTCEACGAPPKSLAGAGRETGLPGHDCAGNRPWLGPDARKPGCPEPVRMVQRGASNVYFGNVVSSILIPPFAGRYYEIVNNPELWHMLTHGLASDARPDTGQVERVLSMPKYRDLDPERLLELIEKKRAGELVSDADESECQFRLAEYRALNEPSARGDDHFRATHMDPRSLDGPLSDYFRSLVRVEKLAETRALVGLSRLIPPDSQSYPATADKRELSLRRIDWLPANRVYGEGIFFTMDQDALGAWSGRRAVRNRTDRLARRHEEVQKRRGRAPRMSQEKFAKFLLLHTFAHALIRQLTFQCGYASSALRERVYCDDETVEEDMSGVLIYTADGDCEGTLGGLVSQAEPDAFGRLVADAILSMRWCSSDPLCVEAGAQGADGLNMAACHACVLLPETSCEEGNRLLDRALLVGDDKNSEVGFFSPLIERTP